MHTKDKGDIAEQFVIAHCLKRGWIVSKTIGDNKKYDLVLDRNDGVLLKVQVKWGNYDANKGAILISTKSCGYTFDGEGNRELFTNTYSLTEVDYFASYCLETNTSYLIKNEGKGNVNLRIEEPKNGQKLKVKYAKNYVI